MIWRQRIIETNFFETMTAKNHSSLTCSKTQERLDTELNLIDLRMNSTLRLHIKHCPECTKVWNENLRLKKALQRSIKKETAPDGLREKIQTMLNDKV